MTLALKYPLGIQTFSEIREENYVYVDKTAIIYELITTGKIYFLSRPRRFGKSLLVSTLEALFKGQKALFDGLAIANTDYDFDAYPVVKLEFSKDEFTSADSLRHYIHTAINRIANDHHIQLIEDTYVAKFDELVVKLHQKYEKKVVLLIDEYDKPILNNLNKPYLSEIKQVISTFYGVIKPLDEHLKFVFITGVSKFAKVSVLIPRDGGNPVNVWNSLQGSGMNSLRDISMNRQYSTLCGVSQQELEDNFAPAIADLANLEAVDERQMLAKIKYWYNGYRFHYLGEGVYNPFSLLSLFLDKEFLNFWFTSGTPTFLLDLLQEQQYDLKDLSEFKIGNRVFDTSDSGDINILAVFVQTGYLTIKAYDEPLYVLDFPNYEVKKSFFDSIVDRYSYVNSGMGQSFMLELTEHINAGRVERFFATLGSFFANIPYDLNVDMEKYYQSLFYAIFTLIGFNIEAEVHTNQGRIDCVIETSDSIYLIEFKLNDTKEKALQQIHDNHYPQKYQNRGKKLVLLGVEFDQNTRNIGEFIKQVV